MTSLRCALALFALAAVTTGALARPISPAERRYLPYDGDVLPCGDQSVLSQIQSRFGEREEEYWKSGLSIMSFDEPHEIGFRSNGLDYIPRRYCTARAMMNDSRVRLVSYSVAEKLGFLGTGWGVEYCVAGLDRNDAFAPACKMARP